MKIRKAKIEDINELIKLFSETITNYCSADYNEEQIKIWVSLGKEKQKWMDSINRHYFLVAVFDNQIVGFGSLKEDASIDLLYVHQNFLRQGIASQLLCELETELERQHKTSISADVSITAKPFFEKHGFRVIKEQKNRIKNVEIINYKMIKEN